MSNLALFPLWQATYQTLYMVFFASFVGVLVGLLLGIWLYLTSAKQAWQNTAVHQTLGFIVNVTRSVPFIILLIAIVPLTHLLVGTTIGTTAAIVPLTIAAIPFYARIVESAISEVPLGLTEALHAMGASTWQIVCRVWIPEALPALVKGATLTVIGLIGYSAMAGAVGGGGLGELAVNYGYQRFNVTVMIETVVILVILVQLVQAFGDVVARRRFIKSVIAIACAAFVILFVGAFFTGAGNSALPTVRVGIMAGIDNKIMQVAKKVAWQKYHLRIKLVTFTDYVQPNVALNNGSLDANIFQHVPYLNAQIKLRHFKLTPIAKTFVYPMGFYSKKIHRLSQLHDHALVAIPNDPSNEGRALLILQHYHLIKLRKAAGLFATPHDILANPKHLRFIELDAAQLPRVLNETTIVALTDDYVGLTGFTVDDAIMKEGPDSPYANVVVVQTSRRHDAIFKNLVKAVQSKAVVRATMKAFPGGAAIKAF